MKEPQAQSGEAIQSKFSTAGFIREHKNRFMEQVEKNKSIFRAAPAPSQANRYSLMASQIGAVSLTQGDMLQQKQRQLKELVSKKAEEVSSFGIRGLVNYFFGGMGGERKPWLAKPSKDDPKKWKNGPQGQEQLATFGAGCYWGTEKFFATDFEERFPGAILGTSVGFMSPNPNAMKEPSYNEVCTGVTSHVEVAHIKFDS
mmetsp:Transcript_12882/g.21793  ORF Transcript_12882/g.21793 Transcript_12882/m.21793 type:complete len:201 (+) Transcript_12882:269-871(+)